MIIKKSGSSYYDLFVLLWFLIGASPISVISGMDTTHVDVDDMSSGRRIDVFNHKGGRRYNVSSPPFELDEEVRLFANVTYNGGACWGYDVLFQINDPSQNIYILYGKTNYSGIATTDFYLSGLQPGILGVWRITASVNIAGIVVVDTMEFDVWWNLADIDRDYIVGIADVALVASRFGCNMGTRCYDASIDITGFKHLVPDGKIDIIDIAEVARRFGATY